MNLKSMKILVLAWEFPPRIIGGIARHVAELYPEIVKLGHEIHLLTVEYDSAPLYEIVEGIKVHRVGVGEGHDFFHWVVNMNESMGTEGGKLILAEGPFDLIHAHDWVVSDAAVALKHHFQVHLCATIHATEYGRYNGLYNHTHYYINGKEKHLAREARRIIVCSKYMQGEVERTLDSPGDKINVIYNGIRPEKKRPIPPSEVWEFRRNFARDEEKIVYYLGRMSYEKGVEVLLRAAPKVLREKGGNVKFLIIGGGNTDHLQGLAWDLGIWHQCCFTGFMAEADLDKFQTIADCAVFPSLYEPFGIVALESFAARVPVVVSNAGGLPEVVRDRHTGIVTWTNNPDSLASGILEILQNPDRAQKLVENAYQDLNRRFSWSQLARQTEAVYQQVLS